MLGVSGKRIIKLYQPDTLIATIIDDDLRLEHIPESEEDVDSEFSQVLASVLNDSANLVRKGLHTDPFLMVIDRSDTGRNITDRICEKLKITDSVRVKVLSL